jgi:serine/threonine protein kinase
MGHPLTEISCIDTGIEPYLNQIGAIFRVFSFPIQDSGCVSYGVLAQGQRWFVKHSNEPRGIASLQRARHVNVMVQHDALPRLHNSFETPGGLALVYDWVAGELLRNYTHRSREQRRHEPTAPPGRFRALPLAQVLDILDTIYDVHVMVAARGFVAVDFYDGCIIYDFDRMQTHLCDLDEYRPGPFVLADERLPGSRRFMAPEEFQRGATIDQVTNVFTLGRTAMVLLGDGTGSLAGWRGSDAMRDVVLRATTPERAARHQTVREFVGDWRAALG